MTRDKRTRRGPSIGVERLDQRVSLTSFAFHAFPIVPTHFPTTGHGPVVPLTGMPVRVLY